MNRPGYFRKMAAPAVMVASALLFLLCLNAAISRTRLWYWFPTHYADALKLYAFAQETRDYDVVIIGSSASYNGVIAGAVEDELNRLLPRAEPWQVYNMGFSGACLPGFIEVSRFFLGPRVRPRLVVVVFTTFNFSETATMLNSNVKRFSASPADFQTVLLHAPDNRMRWDSLKALLHGIQVVMEAPFIPLKSGPVSGFRERRGSLYRYPLVVDGVAQNEVKPASPAERWESRDHQARYLMTDEFVGNFRIGPLIEVLLDRLAADLKAKGLPFVFTLSPESEYLTRSVYRGERDQAERCLSSFCARHNIPYHDLSRPPFHFDDADFADGCNHLGLAGAERLSREMARHVIAPALGGGAR